MNLEADESADCTFTLAGYAPDAAGSRTNTVDVTVDEVDGDREDSAEDDSTVRTEEVAGGGEEPTLAVDVDKTNDANQDEAFSDSETAEGLDQDVEFQVEVTNDGDETVTVSELTDTFQRDGEDVVLDLLSGETTQDGTTLTTNTCAELDAAELELAAGDTVTFTLAGYSPTTVDEDRVNTVDVVVTDDEQDDELGDRDDEITDVRDEELTNERGDQPTDEQDIASEGDTRVLGNVIERDVTVQAQADDRELARTGLSAAHLAMLALMLLGIGYAATRMRPQVDNG